MGHRAQGVRAVQHRGEIRQGKLLLAPRCRDTDLGHGGGGMGIISPTLRKLAEGRTEITTGMIAEAERIDAKARVEAGGLLDYLPCCVQNAMHQENLMQLYAAQGMAQAQYAYNYQVSQFTLGLYPPLPSWWYQPMQYQPQPRCPYFVR